MSRQLSIDCVLWLLVVTVRQLYNEEEQAAQRERWNIPFEENRSTRNCNGAESSTQADEDFKEKLDAKWDKGSSDPWEILHPAKLPTYERELKKNLSSEGKQQQQEANAEVILREDPVPALAKSRAQQLQPHSLALKEGVVESPSETKTSCWGHECVRGVTT